MVDVVPIRLAIEAAIAALVPQATYALPEPGLAEAWTVSPDVSEESLSPRDLLAHVQIGGPRCEPGSLSMPIDVAVVVAAYTGTRQQTGSLLAMRAADRAINAALHLGEALAALGIGDGLLSFDEVSEPMRSEPPDWLVCIVHLTLITRR